MGIMDKLKDTVIDAIEKGKSVSNSPSQSNSSNTSANASYRTVFVEAGSGVFKNSYEKLAPKIDEACNNLGKDGFRVFSIIAPGFAGDGHAQVFITGVKNLGWNN